MTNSLLSFKFISKLRSESLSPDAPRELHVFGHHGYAPRMNGAEARILKQRDHVGLARFLNSSDGRALKPQVALVFRSNLAH